MEKRLIAYDPITFDAFARSIIKHRAPYDYYDDGYIDAVERIEEWLEQNTVDAVEVIHGEWEKQQGIYSCSICGKACPYDVQADIIQYWQCNYCPNCGADMRDMEDAE